MDLGYSAPMSCCGLSAASFFLLQAAERAVVAVGAVVVEAAATVVVVAAVAAAAEVEANNPDAPGEVAAAETTKTDPLIHKRGW